VKAERADDQRVVSTTDDLGRRRSVTSNLAAISSLFQRRWWRSTTHVVGR
jgi:hypothetical protein